MGQFVLGATQRLNGVVTVDKDRITVVDTPYEMTKESAIAGITIYRIAALLAGQIEMTSNLKRHMFDGEYAVGEDRKNDIFIINFLTNAMTFCACKLVKDMSFNDAAGNANRAGGYVMMHVKLFKDFLEKFPEADEVDYFNTMFMESDEE